jgi:transcriptional regulator with XRE-family HTH domain
MKNTDFQKAVSSKIKSIIDERYHGNNSEFARAIGVTPANISRWLQRSYMPSIDAIYLIAKTFQVPVSVLLGLSNDVPAPAPVKRIEDNLIPLIEFPQGTRRPKGEAQKSGDNASSPKGRRQARKVMDVGITSDQIPRNCACVATKARTDNHGRGILKGDTLFVSTKWEWNTCVAVVVEPANNSRGGVTVNIGVVVANQKSGFWLIKDSTQKEYAEYRPHTYSQEEDIYDVVVLPVLVVQRNYATIANLNNLDETSYVD